MKTYVEDKTIAGRKQEIAIKVERLKTAMAEEGLDAVIINKSNNFSWITAGASNIITRYCEEGVEPLAKELNAVNMFLMSDIMQEDRSVKPFDRPVTDEEKRAASMAILKQVAEYVRVSEKMAFKLPETLPTPIAAYAEPLACVINGANKMRVNPAESVCVIGAGPVGLLFIQLLKASGAKPIISVEPNPLRREYALKCGADYVIDPINENTKERVMEITGRGADYSIDVVGNQFPAALDVIRKGGTVLLMGNNARANPAITQSQITYKEAKVLGTWLANASFDQAVRLLDSGLLNLEFMITHTLPLDQIHEAIDLLRRGEGVEVLVDPNL